MTQTATKHRVQDAPAIPTHAQSAPTDKADESFSEISNRGWTKPPALRSMMTLPECALDAGVSRRFLEKEILRGRLVAMKLSSRICRVRRKDWDRYLDGAATAVR
jgi:hypothetical protein